MENKTGIHLLGAAFLAFFCVEPSATVLGDLAAALPEKTFVRVPANASLAGLNIASTLFAWNNSAVWDPVRKQIRQVCAAGTCCSNGQYYMVTYDDATDAWGMVTAPLSGPGHAYDGNAVNPANGFHYFARYYDNQVRTWDGAKWGVLAPLPFPPGTTPALSWFPDINAGKGAPVYLGTSGQLAWYDHSTFKWNVLPTLSGLGTYNTFSEYNSVHKVLWLGAGNGGERVHYKLDAQLKATRLKDAPINLNNHHAIQSADPVSGEYIVFVTEENSSHAVWEFDITTDTWRQVTEVKGPRPFAADNFANPYVFQVPISDYGVILYVDQYATSENVYLYKHAESSAAEAKGVRPAPGSPLRISPNPLGAGGVATVFAPLTAPHGLTLFTLNGKKLSDPSIFGGGNLIDGSRLSPGVYLLQAETNAGRLLKKVVRR